MSMDDYFNKILPLILRVLQSEKIFFENYFVAGLLPNIDTSKFINDEGVDIYQWYMGIFCCIVDIGRIDLAFGAANMAQYHYLPREE